MAFRTRDDAEQLEYQQLLAEAGFGVTEVKDRQYFHSIYFRSPGGVLFEVATDAPGFAVDEPVELLGQSLKLPPWLEPHRFQIEKVLPNFSLEPMTSAAKPEGLPLCARAQRTRSPGCVAASQATSTGPGFTLHRRCA